MNTPRLQDLVVIGGGLAGLAAAEEGVRGGRGGRVTIVEPAGRVGGVIESARRDGWLVERSADSFLAARPEGVELVERLGLGGDLIGIEPRVRRALILHRGRLVPVPSAFRLMAAGDAGSILTTPLLSLAGRLRLLCEPLVPRGHASDETLEHFAVRRLGREAFERLVQPLVAGIWTADPAKLSMAAACPEFLDMERRHGSLAAGERARRKATPQTPAAAGARYGQFVSLANGMETLPRRLWERLEAAGVRLERARATSLARTDGGRWCIGLDSSPSIEADGVVVAVPAAVASRILDQVDPTVAGDLAAIEYAGSAVVSLGFHRHQVAHPLDAAGMVVPRREGRRILAVSFLSSKFPGRAPEGHVLLRTFVGGALDPEAARLDDDALVALVRRELADILGVSGDPALVQIDRWHATMPQYHLGHVERVARIRQRLREIPGLAVAGAAYTGVGIPQVIASGQEAARAALA
jgi:oxygen-dependent protoporphyrinogen oxidase